MKKIICLTLIACLAISFAGCKKPPVNSTPSINSTGNTTEQNASNDIQNQTKQAFLAVSVPSVTEDTKADDGTVVSRYTYQHMSLVLHKPEVADKVILDFLNRVDSTKESADTTAAAAKAAYTGGNWTPYLYHITYSPTRIDENVLSLFGNNVVYNGATHPDRTCVSASYDLQTGDVLTLASIMAKDASVSDICQLVLNGLSEMAEGDYLYEGYKQTVSRRFDADPTTDEDWYLTTTGLCFYFAPYEIAPYASGVISVEIPYKKLGGILHEAYFPVKENATTGNITVTAFDGSQPTDTTHIAEIVTHTDGQMYLIRTDGTVQDVRILQSDTSGNYTVFAANVLSSEDGIMIQTNGETLKNLKLTYKSGGETQSKPLG